MMDVRKTTCLGKSGLNTMVVGPRAQSNCWVRGNFPNGSIVPRDVAVAVLAVAAGLILSIAWVPIRAALTLLGIDSRGYAGRDGEF